MKKMIGFLTAVSLTFASVGQAVACTSILITDTEGRAYHGRTLEYSALLPMDMTYLPAGMRVISLTPSGNQGVTFDTKYPILGMSAKVVTASKQVTVAEGINDQGLSFSANWLNGTRSPAVGKDHSKVMSVSDLGIWILGNFRNAQDVKEAIKSGKLEFWVPEKNTIAPDTPLPLHYSINDKKGGSIVVEFLDGKPRSMTIQLGS